MFVGGWDRRGLLNEEVVLICMSHFALQRLCSTTSGTASGVVSCHPASHHPHHWPTVTSAARAFCVLLSSQTWL